MLGIIDPEDRLSGHTPYLSPKTETLASERLQALHLATLRRSVNAPLRAAPDVSARAPRRPIRPVLTGAARSWRSSVRTSRAGELPRFELKAKRTVDLRDSPVGVGG